MIKSKGIDFLKSLTVEELKEVNSFISSPFFNKNKTLIKLFDFLKKFYPEFSDKKLSVENIYASIFGKSKTSNQKVVFNLLSELHTLLEEYAIQKGLNIKSEVFRESARLRYYANKNLGEHWQKRFEKIQSSFKKPNFYTDYHYFYKNLITDEKLHYYTRTGRETEVFDDRRLKSESFVFHMLKNIVTSYTELKVPEEIFGHKEKLTVIYDFLNCFDFDKFLESLKQSSHPDYELILISYHQLNMHVKEYPENIEHIDASRELILKNIQLFEKSSLYSMLLRIELQYIKLINIGKMEFAQKLFELFKMYDENELLVYENKNILNQFMFINIINVALTFDGKWSEYFLEKYYKFLHPDLRENIYHFAKVLFTLHVDYNATLENLQKIDFKTLDMEYQITGRIYLLVTYYELEHYESCFALIDASKKFINKKELVSDDRKARLLIIINSVNKLAKMKSRNEVDFFELKKLRKEVDDFAKKDFLPMHNWITDKIDSFREK